jgi:glutathione synthase/RimK-type ligase-like ATP-grasp enzyme
MKRIPRQGDFRANFSLGGTVEPFKVTPEIEELALRATKACGLLMSGVDVLVERNNGKLWILEANRTPGLEGITKAMGNEIADQVLEHMILRSN